MKLLPHPLRVLCWPVLWHVLYWCFVLQTNDGSNRVPRTVPEHRNRSIPFATLHHLAGLADSHGGATRAVIEQTTFSHIYRKTVRGWRFYRARLRLQWLGAMLYKNHPCTECCIGILSYIDLLSLAYISYNGLKVCNLCCRLPNQRQAH